MLGCFHQCKAYVTNSMLYMLVYFSTNLVKIRLVSLRKKLNSQ